MIVKMLILKHPSTPSALMSVLTQCSPSIPSVSDTVLGTGDSEIKAAVT